MPAWACAPAYKHSDNEVSEHGGKGPWVLTWNYMVMRCQLLGVFAPLVFIGQEAQEPCKGRHASSSSSLTKLLQDVEHRSAWLFGRYRIKSLSS
jgi:hypothetical protein